MRVVLIAAAGTMLSAAAPAPARFPSQFQGSWADSPSGCEPEFTQGFKIRSDEISNYEGAETLIHATPVVTTKTKAGTGQTIIAKLRYRHHDEISNSTERFTIVGKFLYRSDVKKPLASHVTPANRTVRCPLGSTDG